MAVGGRAKEKPAEAGRGPRASGLPEGLNHLPQADDGINHLIHLLIHLPRGDAVRAFVFGDCDEGVEFVPAGLSVGEGDAGVFDAGVGGGGHKDCVGASPRMRGPRPIASP